MKMRFRTKKIFSKLFFSYFLISILGLAILLLITRFAFENFYYKEISASLVQKARLVEDEIRGLTLKGDFEVLQKQVRELSIKSKNRITIILPSGKVIADSSFSPVEMENHIKREEVVSAMKKGFGRSIRFSPTLKERHLYVAIPLTEEDRTVGILRNSVSVQTLKLPLCLLTEKIVLWSLVLLLILTYLIYIQARKISIPLERLKKQLEVFALGTFKAPIETGPAYTEEFTSLFEAAHVMSKKLQGQFEKIEKQKKEQLAVFRSMLEGVITISSDLKIYHINQAAIDLFKYPAHKKIKGLDLLEVVKSENILLMAQTLLRTSKTIDVELEYGEGMVLNVHGTILQSPETGMLGAVLVFDNITKMRELENHRKQFVANVSHELKTPLTVIQGYLETLLENDIDDKLTLKRFLGVINKHSIRLKTIIEDLLSLSSIEKESERGGIELEKQFIFPAIENVISLCLEKSKRKKMTIHLEGENVEAMINKALFEQAMINLIDNALKYGPEESDVLVQVKERGGDIEVIVSDKGIGIPKEHHDRLFERFYSVDRARSRELGGSGLGLSIVKHIALSHGGHVAVESEVGRGTSFIFTLSGC